VQALHHHGARALRPQVGSIQLLQGDGSALGRDKLHNATTLEWGEVGWGVQAEVENKPAKRRRER